MRKAQNFYQAIALLIVMSIFCLPTAGNAASAQVGEDFTSSKTFSSTYNKVTFKSLPNFVEPASVTEASELTMEPLSEIEENLAKELNSHWAWAEYTLEMIDSYSPFLFRTKKSAAIEEVKVLLEVNAKGKLSGFEIIGEVDKGLRERIDYLVRKLPACKPVPGFTSYESETFELTIKK